MWQAAVGAWPIDRDRLHAYAQKAAREAGVSTAWIDPDTEFEQRLRALVDAVYDDAELHASIGAMADRLAGPAGRTRCAPSSIQLTMPGVPDVYQGSELWDLLPGGSRTIAGRSTTRSATNCCAGSTTAGVRNGTGGAGRR